MTKSSRRSKSARRQEDQSWEQYEKNLARQQQWPFDWTMGANNDINKDNNILVQITLSFKSSHANMDLIPHAYHWPTFNINPSQLLHYPLHDIIYNVASVYLDRISACQWAPTWIVTAIQLGHWTLAWWQSLLVFHFGESVTLVTSIIGRIGKQ